MIKVMKLKHMGTFAILILVGCTTIDPTYTVNKDADCEALSKEITEAERKLKQCNKNEECVEKAFPHLWCGNVPSEAYNMNADFSAFAEASKEFRSRCFKGSFGDCIPPPGRVVCKNHECTHDF